MPPEPGGISRGTGNGGYREGAGRVEHGGRAVKRENQWRIIRSGQGCSRGEGVDDDGLTVGCWWRSVGNPWVYAYTMLFNDEYIFSQR